MKKIGILTFHRAVNYGAVLQAIALNKSVNNILGNCEIVDYKNEKIENTYGFQTKFSTNNILKKIILFLVKNSFFFSKKIKFNKFLKKYANLSKKSYDLSTIREADREYDLLISGSDQVFNLELTGNDKTYFLDFAAEDKIRTYAASFGFEKLEDNLQELYKKLMRRFKYLSIREKSGCDICNGLVEQKVYQHIDPTLLLTGNEWIRLVGLKKEERKKYILLYTVAKPKKLIDYVEKKAAEENLDVIEISNNLKKTRKSFKSLRSCGPKEFLQLILNAEYVATTSFHGTAFSVLFHKKMLLEVIDSTGKKNVRINNLLKISGIKDIKNEETIEIKNVNWNKVDANIQEQREQAFEYLKMIKNKAENLNDEVK